MARRRKTTYEDQAKLSVVLAVVGGVCVLASTVFILQRFDFRNFWIVYNPRSLRLFAIGIPLAAAMGASGIGFLIGLNSAGQRLNKKNKLSWTGFFLNATVITLALCCGIFFWLAKYAIPIKPAG